MTLPNCDAMFFFGQNTGSNSPRFLHPLQDAAKRGVQIITFNPVREKGLETFVNPQNPSEMLTGKETRISSQYHQVKIGGDIAVMLGICKHVFAADDKAKAEGKRVLDVPFIEQHTNGFEAFEAKVRSTSWDEIEAASGLAACRIEAAAQVYVEADRVIGIYGMGLTQHVHGFENIAMFVNLLLLKGNIGRDGTGISPVRGHSNVQGQRTVGISEKPELVPLDKLAKQFGFEPPREKGMNTVEACEGILAGKVKAFFGLGGNFVRAIPERAAMEEAWVKMDLTVQIATKLNHSHLVNGKSAYLLPCRGRTEQDMQASGPQAVTMEDTFSCIQGSIGLRKPASEHLKSELEIVAGLAKATLPPNPKVKWDEWVGDYGLVRDLIAETYPDEFHDFNARMFTPGGFYRGNAARERIWKTKSGKAEFTVPDTLTSIGFEDAPGPLPPAHHAQQRPVQHHDLRLERPASRHRGHAPGASHESRRHRTRRPQGRPDGVAGQRCRGRHSPRGRAAEGHAIQAAGRLRRFLLPRDESAGGAVEPRQAVEDPCHQIGPGQRSARSFRTTRFARSFLFRDGCMQIFRPGANTIATLLLASLGVVPVLAVGLAYQIVRSPYVTDQNVTRDQPVPFSHEHHVGGLGLDCRYCHTSVEKARFAGLAADRNLHDLPFPALDQRRDAGAGAREPGREQADPLAARQQAARLRLLRPFHPYRQGRRLHHLPRAHRSDEADAAGRAVDHELVPRLSPRSGQGAPPARGRFRSRLEADWRPRRARDAS